MANDLNVEEVVTPLEGEHTSLRDNLEAEYDALSKSDEGTPDAKAVGRPDGDTQSTPVPVATTQTAQDEVVPAALTKWAKDNWAQLPPEWRKEIAKREGDSTRAVQTYAEDRKFADVIRKEFEPYRGLMQQFNASEGPTIRSALETMATLATGTPEQKMQIVAGICQTYGIDPTAVAGGKPSDTMAMLSPIQQELGQVRQTISQLTAAQQDFYREQAEVGISQFLASGSYPQFEVVRAKMGELMSAGHAQTLKDAYEQAVMLVPEARQEFLDAEWETRRQKMSGTANLAKRAAVSQRGSPLPGSMPREEPTNLRGSLEKAWDELS